MNAIKELKTFSKANMYYSKASGFDSHEIKEHHERMRNVLARVCDYFKIDVDRAMVRSRKEELVKIRYIAAYLMEKEFGYDYKDIAKFFNRDRATFHHGIKSIKGFIETGNKEYLKYIKLLSK